MYRKEEVKAYLDQPPSEELLWLVENSENFNWAIYYRDLLEGFDIAIWKNLNNECMERGIVPTQKMLDKRRNERWELITVASYEYIIETVAKHQRFEDYYSMLN